jgi:two-component system chemotaxis response regulator CheB
MLHRGVDAFPGAHRISLAGAAHGLIVIGTSTGGVEALIQIAHELPEDLPAAICVVMHMSAQATSMLPQILSRYGPLPATHPADKEPIAVGHIYVAPPDRHLLVERGRLRITHGPKENRVRPAIDPLFRSAALAYGPQVVGVVLTGALDDGTSGLLAIRRRRGVVVVQDPKDALIPSMPESAVTYVEVDHVVPLASVASLLTRLAFEPARETAEGRETAAELLRYEARMAQMEEGTMARGETPGTLSSLTCPECGGPIYELRDDKLVRFRCRSGHAYTAESMAAQQSETVEEALWGAVNTLMESAELSGRLARDARKRGNVQVAGHLDERQRDSRRRAELIRRLLRSGDPAALDRMPGGDPAARLAAAEGSGAPC